MSTRNDKSLAPFVHAAFVVVSLLSASVASGAGFTWDASGGTPLNDGGGAWNATGGTNWFDGTNYGAWGNTSADTATFGVANGAAGTITVGNVTANALTFSAPGSGNYTLSSGTLTMAGTLPTITVNASGTTTISTVLTGSSDWTKSGTGTLFLSNAATTFGITGTTTVNGGVLALNGPLAPNTNGLLGNSAGFVINDGGTIRVESWNALMGYNSSNVRPVTVNAGGLLTMTAGNTAWIRGTLTLAGGTLAGGFATQWGGWGLGNATTTVTENSTISASNVVLSNATANVFDVAASKTLSVTGNFGFGADPGSKRDGNLTKSGAGTMTLAGANTYTGTTSVNAGTLQIGNSGTVGSISGSSVITGSAGAVLAFNRTDNYGGNFSNRISGGLGVTINSGALTLTGSNSFSGDTLVNSGTLVLGHASALGGSTLDTAGSGNLSFGGLTAATFGGLKGGGGLVVTNTAGTAVALTVGGNNQNATYSGTLSGLGSLIKIGTGTMTLAGANTHTGTTTVSAGALRLDNNLALQNSVPSTSGGGSLALGTGVTTPTIGGLVGSTNVATAFGNWSQVTALTLNPLSGTATYTGVISNGAAGTTLTKTGAGTQVLQSPNTYTGTTTVNGGVLALNGDNTSTGILGNSAGFVINDGGTIRVESWNALMGFNSGNVRPVTVNAGGLLTMTAGNTAWLRGTLTLAGGTLAGGASADYGGWALGNATTTVTENSTISGSNVVLENATANVFDVAAGKTLSVTGNFGFGTLSKKNGNLTKSGAGTMTLAGANTYTGTTTASAGTLRLDNNLALQNSALNTSGGGSLALGTGVTTPTIGGLAGNTNLATAFSNWSQATALTLNPLVLVTATYSGVIADGVAGTTLTKTGGGTQVLESTNTYTGITTVNEGLLVVRGANTVVGILGNSAGFVINNGGSIRVDSWNALMGYDPTANVRPVTVNAGGLLTMTAGNTAWIKGTLTLAGGTLAGGFAAEWGGWTLGNATTTVTENSTISGSNVVLANTAANVFDVAAGKTLSVTGNFGFGSDPGSKRNGNLTKSGAGTMTLAGANAYTGTTTILAGTLQIGNSGTVGSISGSSVITGSAGGALAFSRTDAYGGTFGNTIGGGIGLTLNSGTLTLSGSNTFNGTTKLVAGALTVGNANALQNSTLDMNGADAGSITFSQNSTLGGLSGSRNLDMGTRTLTIGGNGQSTTYSGGLSNGALTKLGSGTLTLSGSNSYSGSTAVDAGTLVVNGSLANSSLTVASGATLMGSGTIAGLTTIAGLHLPGTSPGVETFTNLTYNAGAGVQWELWGNTVSNSPTMAFDQVVVNGNLTFSGPTTLDLVFTGSAGPSSFSSVNWANAFWDSNQEWLLYDVAGTLATANNLTLNVTNWQDSTGAFFQTARPNASFSVEQRTNDVYIVYAVPEPSTAMAACIGIAIAAWSLGRRRPASRGLREEVRDRVAPDTPLPAATQS